MGDRTNQGRYEEGGRSLTDQFREYMGEGRQDLALDYLDKHPDLVGGLTVREVSQYTLDLELESRANIIDRVNDFWCTKKSDLRIVDDGFLERIDDSLEVAGI